MRGGDDPQPAVDRPVIVPCARWHPDQADPGLLARPTPGGPVVLGYRALGRLVAVHGSTQPWFAAREEQLRSVLRPRATLVVDETEVG